MQLRIEKQGYSVDPWRIVDENGRWIMVNRLHPLKDVPPIEIPLAFATKEAAITELGILAGKYIESLQKEDSQCLAP